MDLSNFNTVPAANAGAPMTVRDPSGAPIVAADGSPVTITLRGRDSEVFLQTERKIIDRRVSHGGSSAAAREQDGIDLLAKCTVSWCGIVVEGEELECTEANARRVYRDFRFIRDQADAFIGDRSHFMSRAA